MRRPSAAFAIIVAALLALVCSTAAARAQGIGPAKVGLPGAAVDTGHVSISLLAGEDGIAPGSTVHLALKQVIDKGWHTYWRNPGDSGEPTKITWTLPAGWQSGDIVWAPPQRLPVGPLMNYGYSNEVVLPVAITAPANAKVGDTVRVTALVDVLVCEEICIPERGTVSLDLPVVVAPSPHPQTGALVARALSRTPRPAAIQARFEKVGETLKLAAAGEPIQGASAGDAYFFPFQGDAIDPAKPQAIERGPEGLTLTLTPGYAFQAPAPPATLAGVLSVDGRFYEIEATRGPAPAGVAGLGAPVSAAKTGSGGGGGLGLPLALAFAFVGGLILNLMPCVFPVLSMKAASLAGHAHDAKAARVQGLAFTAGVLVTFLALAGALIAAKAAGAAVGWGFQLQSPALVAALALLMLLIALNLSGVFEIGGSLQNTGSRLAGRGGVVGAALTGALAVIVAAPCTAPLMAGALGFALTQSAPMALLVFAALGLGFAAPFLALSLSPALLARMPRPGPWMDGLRKVLAFPMYGAAAWLIWVLTLQAGTTTLAALLAAAVVLALAAWLYGAWQRRSAQGAGGIGVAGAAAACAALAVVIAIGGLRLGAAPATAGSDAQSEAEPGVTLASTPWSPERLAALRAEGKPVLVNFTAAWCVTCQVNERAALSRKSVADAFSRTGAVYLKADWTSRDAVIAAALAEHGRAGVPLYLMYGRDPAAPPTILPQLLTDGTVIAALEKASAPKA